MWKSTAQPLAIEIKRQIVIVKESDRNGTRFLNYEDLFHDDITSIEELTSRQIGELRYNKNITAGNSVLTIFDSYLLKKSYWISSSSSQITSQVFNANKTIAKSISKADKSENDKSDTDEGTDRKMRRIN